MINMGVCEKYAVERPFFDSLEIRVADCVAALRDAAIDEIISFTRLNVVATPANLPTAAARNNHERSVGVCSATLISPQDSSIDI
jgi:hypothetical protein